MRLNPSFNYTVAICAFAALFMVIDVYQPTESAKKPMEDGNRCKYWQAKVDPSVKVSKKTDESTKDSTVSSSLYEVEVSEEDAANVIEACECLLKLKGKTSPSNFSATVSFELSTRFPTPTVEVAALYYVSALYHQNWRHAQAMLLIDKEGKKNTKNSIQRAYKAYRSWLETVREIGVEKARQQRLDPLAGTEIRWY